MIPTYLYFEGMTEEEAINVIRKQYITYCRVINKFEGRDTNYDSIEEFNNAFKEFKEVLLNLKISGDCFKSFI